MERYEKYLEALKTFDDFVTKDEWVERIIELYPEELVEAEKLHSSEKRTPIGKLKKVLPSRIQNKKCKAAIEKNNETGKYKYIPEDQRISERDNNNKLPNFKEVMKAIEYLPDDYDLPQREEYTYFENNAHCVGYKEYIAFEMAIRNKDVIHISEKLDYLDEIIEKCSSSSDFKNWLRGIEYWEDLFEGKSPELMIDSKREKEYIISAKLPMIEFKQEIEFLTNEKEFISEKPEGVIHLKIIADYLQNLLINKYCIYKDGYYFIKDTLEFDPDSVVDYDSFQKHDYNTSELDKYKKSVTDRIVKGNENNMKEIADMFFMYDYFKKREENNSLTLCTLDIKSELTKYHDIKIEGFEESFSYDECLERYEEFKNLEASFVDVETTINKKINYMIDFIEHEQYKFILFY